MPARIYPRPRHYVLLSCLMAWHTTATSAPDTNALAQATQFIQSAQQLEQQGDYVQALRLLTSACETYEQQLTQQQTQYLPEDPTLYPLQTQLLGCRATYILTATTAGQFDSALLIAKATDQRAQEWLNALARLPLRPDTLKQQIALTSLRAELSRSIGTAYGYLYLPPAQAATSEQVTAYKAAEIASMRETIRLERHTLQLLAQLPQPLANLAQDQSINVQKTLLGDAAWLADKLVNLATWYQQQERIQDAAPLLAESEKLLQTLQPDAPLSKPQRLLQHITTLWDQFNHRTPAIPPSASPESQGMRLTAQIQLANAYAAQHDFAKAEQWQLATLSEQQHSLGEQHTKIALQLALVGRLYQNMGVELHDPSYFKQAEQYYQRSVEMYRQLQDKTDITLPLGLLSGLYQEQQRHDEAITVMQQVLEVDKRELYNSTQTTPALRQYELAMKKMVLYAHLNMLGQMNVTAGHYPAAIQYYLQNLAQADNNQPPYASGSKATSLYGLAVASKLQQNINKALDYVQQAEALHTAFPVDNWEQQKSQQELALQKLTIIMQGVNLGLLSLTDQADTLFQTAQQVHGLGRLTAFHHVALRNASDNPAIQAQLTQLWEQQQRLQQLTQSPEQWAMTSNDTNADPQQLQQTQQQQIQTIQRLEADLRLKFPLYNQLAHPQPLSVAQVQRLLKPDEALLMWVENTIPSGVSYLFVVRADQPLRIHQLPITRAQLATELGSNAQGLRASLTHPEQRFDLATAHNLYRQLLAPAEADLVGVKHLIAVPDGLLQNLPLPVLVQSRPTNTDDYTTADWLIKRYSISYLPSVNALANLQTPNNNHTPRLGFIGFGDPRLQGKQLTLANVFRGLDAQTLSDHSVVFTDTGFLQKNLVSLPETADELHHVAQATQGLSHSPPALYLQDDATETRLKQLSHSGELSRVKVLSFATHALLPYEAADTQREAGLVLTPPAQGTADDDGFLSSGEIAALKLNADWVLLSACNTATLNDTDTYAGLSALSKAFITAGSRSVLASRWSVNSKATETLVTDMFNRLQQTPSLRRAEALRQSMLQMTSTAVDECNRWCQIQRRFGWAVTPTTHNHPYYWAAFAIYGDWNPLP